MVAKDHLAPGGMLKCLEIMGHLNNGLPTRITDKYPDLVSTYVARPIVHIPSTIHPWWLTGFTAGDGCFAISITKNVSNRILGFQIAATFT